MRVDRVVGRPGGRDPGPELLVLGGHRGDLRHPELVAHRVDRQLLQPVRHGPQVADDVGQPPPAGGRDESAVQQPAHLAAQVGDRRLGHPPPGAAPIATATSRAWVSTSSTLRTVSTVSGRSCAFAVATSASKAAWSRGGPPAAAISSSAAASTQSATRSGISPSGLNCRARRERGDSDLTTCFAGEPATRTSSRRAPAQVSRPASISVGTTRTPTVVPSSTRAGIRGHGVGAALHLDGARQGAELPRR